MPNELVLQFNLCELTDSTGQPIDADGNTVEPGDEVHVPVLDRAIATDPPVDAHKAYQSPEGWRTPVAIGPPLNLAAGELYPVDAVPAGNWTDKPRNDLL